MQKFDYPEGEKPMKKRMIAILLTVALVLATVPQLSLTASAASMAYVERSQEVLENFCAQDPSMFLWNEYYYEKTFMTQEETDSLNQLAREITAGCSTDAERIHAVAFYLAENIYYYVRGSIGASSRPCDVIETRVAVCEGFAKTAEFLLQCLGIPCVIADSEDSVSFHAYNYAYDGERWIAFDSTWIGTNSYTDGVFQDGPFFRAHYYDFDFEFGIDEPIHLPKMLPLTIAEGRFERFPAYAPLTFYEIPEGVTVVTDGAFNGNEMLEEIVVGKDVTTIEDYAFSCDGLRTITIPATVTSIGGNEEPGYEDVFCVPSYYLTIICEKGSCAYRYAQSYGHRIMLIRHPLCPSEYSDIKSSAWYYPAVSYVIENGLMGSTDTYELTFAPNTKVSRAMVASIMYRIAGTPSNVTYQATFTDVTPNQWYTTAVEWAAQNNLASGKGNGRFDPNGYVTRQELAAFIFRLAEYQNADTDRRASLDAFKDRASVASWAKDYVMWAVAENLLSGKGQSDGSLKMAPTDNATRAELAAIISRLMQEVLKDIS